MCWKRFVRVIRSARDRPISFNLQGNASSRHTITVDVSDGSSAVKIGNDIILRTTAAENVCIPPPHLKHLHEFFKRTTTSSRHYSVFVVAFRNRREYSPRGDGARRVGPVVFRNDLNARSFPEKGRPLRLINKLLLGTRLLRPAGIRRKSCCPLSRRVSRYNSRGWWSARAPLAKRPTSIRWLWPLPSRWWRPCNRRIVFLQTIGTHNRFRHDPPPPTGDIVPETLIARTTTSRTCRRHAHRDQTGVLTELHALGVQTQ